MAMISKYPEISKQCCIGHWQETFMVSSIEFLGLLDVAHSRLSPESKKNWSDRTIFAFRVLATLQSIHTGLFMKQLQLTAEDQKILFWEVS